MGKSNKLESYRLAFFFIERSSPRISLKLGLT